MVYGLTNKDLKILTDQKTKFIMYFKSFVWKKSKKKRS